MCGVAARTGRAGCLARARSACAKRVFFRVPRTALPIIYTPLHGLLRKPAETSKDQLCSYYLHGVRHSTDPA